MDRDRAVAHVDGPPGAAGVGSTAALTNVLVKRV